MKTTNEIINEILNLKGELIYENNFGFAFSFSLIPFGCLYAHKLVVELNPRDYLVFSFHNRYKFPIVPKLEDFDNIIGIIRKNLGNWFSKKYYSQNENLLYHYEMMLQEFVFFYLIRWLSRFDLHIHSSQKKDVLTAYKSDNNNFTLTNLITKIASDDCIKKNENELENELKVFMD